MVRRRGYKQLSKKKYNKLSKKNHKNRKTILKKTCGKKSKKYKTKTIKQKIHKNKYVIKHSKTMRKKLYYGGSNLDQNYPGSAGNYVMMMVGDGQTQKELSMNSAFN